MINMKGVENMHSPPLKNCYCYIY